MKKDKLGRRIGKARDIYLTKKGWKLIRELETFYTVMASNSVMIMANDYSLASKFGQVYRIKHIPLRT